MSQSACISNGQPAPIPEVDSRSQHLLLVAFANVLNQGGEPLGARLKDDPAFQRASVAAVEAVIDKPIAQATFDEIDDAIFAVDDDLSARLRVVVEDSSIPTMRSVRGEGERSKVAAAALARYYTVYTALVDAMKRECTPDQAEELQAALQILDELDATTYPRATTTADEGKPRRSN